MIDQFFYHIILIAQILLLIIGFLWFVKRNDEIPVFINGIIFYYSGYRLWAVTNGIGNWVSVNQNTLNVVTDEKALEVLRYVVLGQVCLIGTYLYRQKRILPKTIITADVDLLNWLRPRIIILSSILLPLVIISRSTVQAEVELGRNLAVEVSGYLFLMPMALVGVSILNVAIWKAGGYTSYQYKLAALFFIVSISYLSFGTTLRFQFLGWIAGAGIIASSNFHPLRRILILSFTVLICLGLFSLAGALRSSSEREEGTNSASALERFLSAEDANMLDGFVLLESVYPDKIEFANGGDHLEILLRPIPRFLWPEKPVGGYANKLGLNDYSIGTTGISPTLFGSFYAEGGVIAIVILSIIYGAIFAAICGYTIQLQPFASYILRGVLSAAIIPLLRGGDLPGIYAWIGMAFWPCFLLLWLKRANMKLSLSPDLVVKRKSILLAHT